MSTPEGKRKRNRPGRKNSNEKLYTTIRFFFFNCRNQLKKTPRIEKLFARAPVAGVRQNWKTKTRICFFRNSFLLWLRFVIVLWVSVCRVVIVASYIILPVWSLILAIRVGVAGCIRRKSIVRYAVWKSGVVWKSRRPSCAPRPTIVRTVSLDVEQHWTQTVFRTQELYVWKSRWPPWAPRPVMVRTISVDVKQHWTEVFLR